MSPSFHVVLCVDSSVLAGVYVAACALFNRIITSTGNRQFHFVGGELAERDVDQSYESLTTLQFYHYSGHYSLRDRAPAVPLILRVFCNKA